MIWKRSETLALARMQCNACRGLGLCATVRGEEVPCDCVLRAIFKACHSRFRRAAMLEKRVSVVKIERTGGGSSSHMYFSRKTEEYIADFTLICKRTLTDDEYRQFKFHYLLGADVKLVASQMKIAQDTLQHRYRVMEIKLGRAFRETEPFALYPLDEYFSDTSRGEKVFASKLTERAD